ncbi:MAG: hypothetical protein HKN03_19025 [Acidimicrobiales bacterium]|nr:hypothetical protein [Acidimicrobiales bacterium]
MADVIPRRPPLRFWPHHLAGLVRTGLLAMALLLPTACGSLGEPYLGSFPTSSTPQEQDSALATGIEDGQDSTSESAVAALPPRPSDYVPSIVVITDAGIAVVDRSLGTGIDRFDPARLLALQPEPDATEPVEGITTTSTSTTTTTTAPQENDDVADEPAVLRQESDFTHAKDDLFGGLVAQKIDGDVLWFPGTGGELRRVGVDGAELMEIGYSLGTPEALTQRAGQIFRTRLVDNESLVFAALEPGEELLDISSAGGVVAVAVSDPQCGSVSFYSGEGMKLAIDPFDTLGCEQPGRPAVGGVAMSPDGEAVAYTVISYREDGVELATELKAVELTSGAEILSVPIGNSGDVIESIAFDGITAVLLRRSSATSEVVVVDAVSSEVLDVSAIGTPRAVSFARLPLSPNFGG